MPDLASVLPCTARCYKASRGHHSDACISIRADHAAKVGAWIATKLVEVRQDVANAIDARPECGHEVDVDAWGWECQPCTADAALAVVAAALAPRSAGEGDLPGEQGASGPEGVEGGERP